MSTELLITVVQPIPVLTQDPTVLEGGELWYNSTEGAYKTYDFDNLVGDTLTLSVKVLTL